MRKGTLAGMALSIALGGLSALNAQRVRYVAENGVTYRETVQRVVKPVAETVIEEREETVLRDRYTTATYETEQTVLTPVTEYRWEARVGGVWNPFVPTHVRYELVPHTTLQPSVQTVRTPVTTRELVPEVRTVRVPTRRLATTEIERVERVAVNTIPQGASIVQRTQVSEQRIGQVSNPSRPDTYNR